MVDIIDPPERFETMLDEATLAIRQEFLFLIESMHDSFDVAMLAAMLGSGRFEQAFEDLGKASAGVGNIYPRHYAVAGEATALWLTENINDVLLTFDTIDSRAVLHLRENKARLVQAFTAAQRRATQAAILQVIEDQGDGNEMAAAFLASIGLTPRQYQSVLNYRRLLVNLDGNALRRALRDPDMDGELRDAISSRTPLTQAQIDKMVDEYRRNMLNSRADAIATTEALAATAAGRLEAYLQAIEQGQLPELALQRVWNTERDERVRGSHKAMEGQHRPFGVPFTSGLGNSLRYPGDPSAPPEDRLQCRCSEGMIIVFPDK